MNGWMNRSLKPISVRFILVLEETPLFIHRAISLNSRAPALHAGSTVIDTKVLNYFSAVKQSFFLFQLRRAHRMLLLNIGLISGVI